MEAGKGAEKVHKTREGIEGVDGQQQLCRRSIQAAHSKDALHGDPKRVIGRRPAITVAGDNAQMDGP